MAHLCCRARFPQKPQPGRFITKISLADDFQRHRASQIDVERFVSDTHGAATQLDWFPVFACQQFIMLKALQRLYWCRPGRFFERRLAGRNPARQTNAKQADWTELHRPKKRVTAIPAA